MQKISTVLKIDSVAKKSISIDSIPPIYDNSKGTFQLKGNPSGGVLDGLITDKNQGIFDPKLVGLGEFIISYEYIGILQCQSGKVQTKIIISEPYRLSLTQRNKYYKRNGYNTIWSQ